MITSVSGRSSSASLGALLVEVIRPGGEVFREAGELGAADRDAGAFPDDILGLPEPPAGQVIRRQGPHPQGIGIIREDLPGVGGVQVRLAAVAVGHPGNPDRPEHARHAPAVPGLHAAVTDPRGARDPLSPLLARGIDAGRGLQQPPLQLAALFPDHFLPLPVIADTGPRPLPRPRARRTAPPGLRAPPPAPPLAGASVPSSRTCLTVTANLTVTAAPPDACRE